MRSGATLARNAGLTLAGSIVGAALSMGNEVVAARFLGVSDYGLYGLALTSAKVGEIIALCGVPLSVMHFLPPHLQSQRHHLALGVIVGSLVLPIAIATGFALCAALGHDWLASRLFNLPQASPYLAVLACAIPLTVLAEVLGSIARGAGRFLPSVVIRNLLPPLCYLAALAVLAATDAPKVGAAYAYTAAVALGAVVGAVWVGRLIHGMVGIARPALRLREFYGFAAPIALNSLVTIVFLWVDMFVLTQFTDSRTVGIYRGCTQVLLTFDLVLTACSVATAPIYALAKAQPSKAQEALTAATVIGTALAVPLAAVIAFNGADILGLLGSGFADGAAALSILAIGQLVKVVFGATATTLIIGGRPGIEAANVTVAACLNAVLNLALVPRLGLVGAAFSTAFSLFVLSALRSWRVRSVLGLRVVTGMLGRVFLVTASLATVVALLSASAGIGVGTGFAALVVRLGLTGLLVIAGLWLFCLGRRERVALLDALRRKLPARAEPPLASDPSR